MELINTNYEMIDFDIDIISKKLYWFNWLDLIWICDYFNDI